MDEKKPDTPTVPTAATTTTTANPARTEMGYFDDDGRWVAVATPPPGTTRTTATRWSRHY